MTEWIDSKSQENRRCAMWLLLIGIFTMTRINIGGKLGISELAMLLAAPIVFFRNASVFRREKIMGFLLLAFLWLVGAVFSDWYNNTFYILAAKGIANPVMVLVNCIVLYALLRKNPENLRWLLLGLAISSVISIFAFQNISDEELQMAGIDASAVTKVTGYKLFWGNMVRAWVGLVISGWYLQTPKSMSLLGVILIMAAYVLCGGRSASASYMVSFILIFIGGTKIASMMRIKRSIVSILIVLALAGMALKTAYKYAALNGLLNEGEQRKYERQTSGGKGDMLSMFMSGRSEIFIATIAALDRPLVGHGSHAIDNKGYVANFFMKYGSDVDQKLYYESALNNIHQIPFHTQIVTFWMWHGILGLIFWCFVLYLVIWTLMRGMAVAPPLFGYFALVLPVTIWDLFFSPFGSRVSECAVFIMCLIARNISRGIKYPIELRKL